MTISNLSELWFFLLHLRSPTSEFRVLSLHNPYSIWRTHRRGYCRLVAAPVYNMKGYFVGTVIDNCLNHVNIGMGELGTEMKVILPAKAIPVMLAHLLVELTVLRREGMPEARAGPRACIQANDAIASEPGQISLFAVLCHSAFCTLVLIIRQNDFLRGILALNIGCICLDMHFATGLDQQSCLVEAMHDMKKSELFCRIYMVVDCC